MKAVFALISRNRKLFFKDRGMFFSFNYSGNSDFAVCYISGKRIQRFLCVRDPGHDYNLRQTDRWNGGRTACRGSSGSQLCDCDILRESYDGTGPGKRNKERF